jgi:hypothetical protein
MVSAERVAAFYGRLERRHSIRFRVCGEGSLTPFPEDAQRDMRRKQVRPLQVRY